jgi:ribosomal protein S6--L-glutamate ligase
MKLISLDAMRTCGILDIAYVKPEHASLHIQKILQAEWLLFPPYWQVNALYYGLKKPVFPSISTYHIGHDKVEMTRAVQLLWPRHMPETLILDNSEASRAAVLNHFEFPFVAKAVKDSMGNDVWLIEDIERWRYCSASQEVLYVQEYLPIECDLLWVVIGRRVVAGYWRRYATGVFHSNVAKGGLVDPAHVPEAAVALVEEMAVRLDIDHAGFDIAKVGDRFYFFEFNRLFGTAGLKKIGILTSSLINAYRRSVSLEDAGVRFKPKIESFAPDVMPALPSRQA